MDGDVLVVGGGLAGLAAATLVARGGRRVEVLEAAADAGGRARSQVHDGFTLNLGPHAVYEGGAGLAVLRSLGIDPPGGAPRVAGGLALLGGELHPGPYSARALAMSPLLGLRERAGLGAFLAGLRGPRPDLAAVSQQDWLAQRRLPGRARLVAETLARLASYADAPAALSAGAVAGQLALAARGVRYVDGGWQAIVDALTQRALAAGVRLRTGLRVTAVGHEGGRPVVALADGATRPASAVVVAAGGPRALARLLGLPAPAVRPGRVAALDVALRRLPRPAHPQRRAPEGRLLPGDPGPTLVLGLDEPLYLSVHSAVAALAPPGGAVVHVARYLGDGEGVDGDRTEHRRRLEELLDLTHPGWRDEVVRARFLPDLTVTTAIPLAAQGGEAGRPDVDAAGLPGVVVAGDWVGPRGMLADASLASAARAARAVLTGTREEALAR